MLTDLLFFLLTGGTLTLLGWSAFELFRNVEDPLGDRLEELQAHAMAAARAPRRKAGASGAGRILYFVSLFPGGDDWVRGSERLLNRAGVRRKWALPLYITGTIVFTLSLLAGMLWLQRANPPGS